MNEPAKDKTFVVHLTTDELAAIVRDPVASALKSAPREDRLLTVGQVAEILNVPPQYLYHNAKKLPFTRKLNGHLRFSSLGLQRWIAARRLKASKAGG